MRMRIINVFVILFIYIYIYIYIYILCVYVYIYICVYVSIILGGMCSIIACDLRHSHIHVDHAAAAVVCFTASGFLLTHSHHVSGSCFM